MSTLFAPASRPMVSNALSATTSVRSTRVPAGARAQTQLERSGVDLREDVHAEIAANQKNPCHRDHRVERQCDPAQSPRRVQQDFVSPADSVEKRLFTPFGV